MTLAEAQECLADWKASGLMVGYDGNVRDWTHACIGSTDGEHFMIFVWGGFRGLSDVFQAVGEYNHKSPLYKER